MILCIMSSIGQQRCSPPSRRMIAAAKELKMLVLKELKGQEKHLIQVSLSSGFREEQTKIMLLINNLMFRRFSTNEELKIMYLEYKQTLKKLIDTAALYKKIHGYHDSLMRQNLPMFNYYEGVIQGIISSYDENL